MVKGCLGSVGYSAALGAQEVRRPGELLMGLPPKCRECSPKRRSIVCGRPGPTGFSVGVSSCAIEGSALIVPLRPRPVPIRRTRHANLQHPCDPRPKDCKMSLRVRLNGGVGATDSPNVTQEVLRVERRTCNSHIVIVGDDAGFLPGRTSFRYVDLHDPLRHWPAASRRRAAALLRAVGHPGHQPCGASGAGGDRALFAESYRYSSSR